ncbi:MAG TPA: CHASE domain-containing protein, partial [Clostridia bacterium]|nr:CHASE domain-containing protein [Clostridia bacterium]
MHLPMRLARVLKSGRLVAVTLFVGLAVSLLLYAAARRWEAQRIQSDFLRHAENRVSALRLTIAERLADAELLSILFASANAVDQNEFQNIASRLVERQPCLQSIEWLPHIDHPQRFEAERALGHLHQANEGRLPFTEHDADGQSVPARDRKEYFPVYFSHTTLSNVQSTIGFDAGSDPRLRETLACALRIGGPVATARIEHGTPSGFSFKVYIPVHTAAPELASTEAAPKTKPVRGFLCESFLINDLADASWAHLQPVGLDKLILDLSAPEANRYLYTQWSRVHGGPPGGNRSLSRWRTGLFYEATFPVADRQWSAIIRATPKFIALRRTHVAESLLLGGLLLTITLSAYLTIGAWRTWQLAQANEKLLSEIMERKRVEQTLRAQHETLQAIVENAPLMIRLIGPDNQTRWVNRAWRNTLQWSLEEAQRMDLFEQLFPDLEYRREVQAFMDRADGTWKDIKARVRSGTVLETCWSSVRLSDGTVVRLG